MTEIVALSVLVLVFLIATVRPVNMGAVALVAAGLVGTLLYKVKITQVAAGFPASLFIILVGVTYLFAIARNNGTVDWLVHGGVRLVRGRVALIPWVMFAVAAIVTAIGAVSPAAVAIIAPVGMGFAIRYGIHPMLMGLCIVMGATGGSFSPMGIFGAITNGVVSKSKLDSNPALLFLAAVLAALLLAGVAFLAYGGRGLARRPGASAHDETAPDSSAADAAPDAVQQQEGADVRSMDAGPSATTLTVERAATLFGLLFLTLSVLVWKLDVGFVAIGIAVLLTLAFPASAKGAVEQIAWGTILLVGGIVTYVSLMEEQGTVQWLGDEVATVGSPLLAALLICLIGAVVSAFASTTGILGALIPLAVPFLLTGQVGAVGLVIALAVSSSVVDCSPFSTNGALVVANAAPESREMVFRHLMRWGMSLMFIAPLVTWAILVLPGRL